MIRICEKMPDACSEAESCLTKSVKQEQGNKCPYSPCLYNALNQQFISDYYFLYTSDFLFVKIEA